jgi:hypothetical protein
MLYIELVESLQNCLAFDCRKVGRTQRQDALRNNLNTFKNSVNELKNSYGVLISVEFIYNLLPKSLDQSQKFKKTHDFLNNCGFNIVKDKICSVEEHSFITQVEVTEYTRKYKVIDGVKKELIYYNTRNQKVLRCVKCPTEHTLRFIE